MTVEKAEPKSPDGDKIAVIIGNCGYSDKLLEDIDARRPDCTLYSWNPKIDGRKHVSPFRLDACISTLKDDGITHVLHAGAVSVSDINALLNDFGQEAERVRAENERYFRFPVLFYEEYARRLVAAGITAISPAGLFEDYAPKKDLFGRLGPDDAASDLLDIARDLKSVAEEACAKVMREEPTAPGETRVGFIPRSMVFEEVAHSNQTNGSTTTRFVEIAIETKGTIPMLRALPRKTKPLRRVLLKVLPTGFPKNLDCPTISPDTIFWAQKRHIDLIAIDHEHGLIIDRENTLEQAEKAGIILLGL